MLDLSEIIAKAEDSPRQKTDVEVVFNANISDELDELRAEQREQNAELEVIESDLAAELKLLDADSRASDPRPRAARKAAEKRTDEVQTRLDDIADRIGAAEERAADFLVTFRFTALPGYEWDPLTAASPPRDGNVEDARTGYNTDDITLVVAKRIGARVGPDDEVIDITAEQWDGIWRTLPADGRRRIKNAIWYLHEWTAQASRNEAVIAARKVLTAQQAATQSSPSDSESTPAASPAGNRSRSSTSNETTAAA